MGVNPTASIFEPVRSLVGNFSSVTIFLLKTLPLIFAGLILWGLTSQKGEVALGAGFLGFFAGFAIVVNLYLSILIFLAALVFGYIAFGD
jgi:hypothetical protein